MSQDNLAWRRAATSSSPLHALQHGSELKLSTTTSFSTATVSLIWPSFSLDKFFACPPSSCGISSDCPWGLEMIIMIQDHLQLLQLVESIELGWFTLKKGDPTWLSLFGIQIELGWFTFKRGVQPDSTCLGPSLSRLRLDQVLKPCCKLPPDKFSMLLLNSMLLFTIQFNPLYKRRYLLYSVETFVIFY